MHNELLLPIPEYLIDQLADRVADKVVARLRHTLETFAANRAKPAEPDPEGPLPTFLRLRDIVDRLGVSRSTVYKWIDEGRFPESVSLGGRAVAWRRVDVEIWETDPLSYGS
ncbi:AlpA family transcriptional regulator [bacterium]|nr:AlpA family transcriptional regulator [bacterium]